MQVPEGRQSAAGSYSCKLTKLQGSQVVCVAVIMVITGSTISGLGCSKATLQASMLPRNLSLSSWHFLSNADTPELFLPGLLVGLSRADSSTSKLMASVARRAAQLRLFGAKTVASAACSYASCRSCMRLRLDPLPTVPGLIEPAASWYIKRACNTT